jgi:NAD(P)-dependent dehydrogenase (short-subunit alcohol dehydrogenase family)
MTAYSDSKLHLCLLGNAVARKWPDVQSNVMDPGWVPTKMGGAGASGDIGAAVKTYLLLINGDTEASGKFWYSSKEKQPKKDALDVKTQDAFLEVCEKVTGVKFPES